MALPQHRETRTGSDTAGNPRLGAPARLGTRVSCGNTVRSSSGANRIGELGYGSGSADDRRTARRDSPLPEVRAFHLGST